MRILIVEDDRKLARQLKKGLEENEHRVVVANDGHEGLRTAQHDDFDILVLDVMLPGQDGFTIVRRLRAGRSAVPILLLTARDAAEDIVAGLDAGADDYLTKPFSFGVLLARLRALARRGGSNSRGRLRIADLILDTEAHEVTRGGMAIPLTPREFALLEMLMKNQGRVLTRGRLIETLWGNDREVENNTLDVFISQLRTKIDSPSERKLIHTIRSIGYTLREEELS